VRAGVKGAGATADAAANAAAAVAAKLHLPVTLADVTNSICAMDPQLFKQLTVPLYRAFWSLRPEDVYVPTDVYVNCHFRFV